MMCFSVTLLPVPEPPTMTSDSPCWMSMDMSRSTGRPLNAFYRCCREMVGSSRAMSEEQLRQKEVRQQDDQRRADHRSGRRSSHALRAAGRVEAAHAAGEREDQAEDGGLDQAAPDVVHLQELICVLLVDDGVRLHQIGRA